MSRTRRLTDDEKASLIATAKLRPCECGTGSWEADTDICFISPDSVRVNNPDIVRRPPLPLATVSCDNCGRVYFFKAP